MQVLINISAEEIETLQGIKEIKDTNDIVFCLHELIERATEKKPNNITNRYSVQFGETRAGKCPSCGGDVGDMYNVCLNCGQRILWEAENE